MELLHNLPLQCHIYRRNSDKDSRRKWLRSWCCLQREGATRWKSKFSFESFQVYNIHNFLIFKSGTAICLLFLWYYNNLFWNHHCIWFVCSGENCFFAAIVKLISHSCAAVPSCYLFVFCCHNDVTKQRNCLFFLSCVQLLYCYLFDTVTLACYICKSGEIKYCIKFCYNWQAQFKLGSVFSDLVGPRK